MRSYRIHGVMAGVVVLACIAAAGGLFILATPTSAQMGGHRGWGNDYWMPGHMNRHMWGPGNSEADVRARMQRHWAFMHRGVPKDYENARSTVPQTPATIGEGGTLYAEHCASCHGKTGLGDGEAGKGLTPSPALLAFLIQRPVAVDEYLLWTISDGGKEFNTAMPAFKETLTREQIWKIVVYMRAGFPDAAKK